MLSPYMKMTVEIDDELLARVMASSGCRTKTAAIELALREMDRRGDLLRLLDDDLAMTPDEWRVAFDEAANPEALTAAARPATYGERARSRR